MVYNLKFYRSVEIYLVVSFIFLLRYISYFDYGLMAHLALELIYKLLQTP